MNVGISSREKGKPTMQLSIMSQKKTKLLLKIKKNWPLWLHMKIRRILNPTTLSTVMKSGMNSNRPMKSSM
jgi:hypothetical protein